MAALLNVNDLDEATSKGIELNNRYLFAVKKDDQVFVYWNRCPHIGTPLEWEEDKFLDMDAALIQCSTHGALFQIDNGLCIAGPCQGKHLKAVPFTIEEGFIVVDDALLTPPVVE